MTSTIFETWLNKLDKDMTRKKRKILMIIDNCSAHPKVDSLKSIELHFLPPNCTSVLQPMDQGIIRNFKFYYRKQSLAAIVDYIDKHKTKPKDAINLLQAIRYSVTAWGNVTADCVKNCFTHGFYSSTRAAPCTSTSSTAAATEQTSEDSTEIALIAQADLPGITARKSYFQLSTF